MNLPPNDWPLHDLEEISDGDTGVLHVDLGLAHRSIHGRLSIADCPERGDREAWAAAREFAARWYAEHEGRIRVTAHRTRTGRWVRSFARYIVDVYDHETGESLSSALLQAGHAVVHPKAVPAATVAECGHEYHFTARDGQLTGRRPDGTREPCDRQ